ncbi:MAG: hypothetical protein A2270_05430 [Elusimicrobia bacterium RIFOXYA12_FULL_51_18]|nr:MAG: hypothetical protein A2270_05430 [Elusimicrobia bacterium RIFOXYA12_FULL_51_18]OGS28734.1 MAG: hypothetical protein A2218_11235 [Elusimicrobia bacterium RIFOXYA2_FULL_53_38]
MSKKNRLKRKEAADAASLGLDGSPDGVFRFPPLLLFAGLLVWFYAVCRNYLPLHPISGLADFDFPAVFAGFAGVVPANALNLLFLVLLIVLSYGIGSGILSVCRIAAPDPERFIFSIGLGFGVIAYLMLLLGALGALHKNLILSVFLAGGAVAAFKTRIWTFKAGALRSEIGEIWKLDSAWKALALLGALFLALNCVMAFVPETFYDSLVYHLATPNYYLLKHKIEPMRFLSHSNFPLNLSMIYMLALSLSNEILAKMIHALTGLLTVLLIYLSVKRNYNAKTAIFSVLTLCATPIFAMNSWTCGNDVGVTFFFALAYVAYLNWLKSGDNGQFALFSVFTGICMGAKYTAVFCVAGFAVSLAVHSWRKFGAGRSVKNLSIFFGTIFLLSLPWLLKDYLFTHNPVHPFFHAVLGGENLRIVGDGGGGMINTPLNLFGFKFTDFLRSPWTLTMAGVDSMTYIGPVFLLLLPCLFMFRKMDREIKHSLLMFCAGYAFWYLGTPGYRYLLPLFVALSVCLGRAGYYFSERFTLFKALAAAMFVFNFTAVFSVARTLGLDGYLGKGASKDDFLSVSQPSYPNPPYAELRWINKNLPDDAKILFVGESRPYYLKRDFISYSVETNLQPLMEFLKRSRDADDFYGILSKEKITHLLVNYREALRNNATYREFNWTRRERDIFDVFWKNHVKLVNFKEGVYVYSVLPGEANGNSPNILEELAKNDWKNEMFMKVLIDNKMWASCLEQYEEYARYGYNVKAQIDYFKSLLDKR